MTTPTSSIDLGSKILERLRQDELQRANPRRKTESKKKSSSLTSRPNHAQVSSANQPNQPRNKRQSRRSKTTSSSKSTDGERLDPPEEPCITRSTIDDCPGGDRQAGLLEPEPGDKVNDREVLLAEIRNLGGTEEDLELVGSLSSSSEQEEVLEDQSEDPQLAQDLKEFMKGLDFSKAHSTVQSDDDLAPSHLTPISTNQRSKIPLKAKPRKHQITHGATDSTQTPKKKKRHRKDQE